MAKTKNISQADIIGMYMETTLEAEKAPSSIYKFCKEHKITEAAFYANFGSFDALKKSIWQRFHDETMTLIHKADDFESYSNREKLLTYFFSFFEMLTLNRSYVLFALKEHQNVLKNLEQLKPVRAGVKDFAKVLIQENNEKKSLKILKQPEQLFSEATWAQLLFLLKFWMDDSSPGFEKTDAAIEKSVNTAFDLFDNTPLDSLIDFGKFLWKEQMS